MPTLTLVLLAIIMVLLIIIRFLGTEMLKKFKFMKDFTLSSEQTVIYKHWGTDSPAMRNIVLRSPDSRQFSTLIGFKLEIPILGHIGFDPYGFVRSDDHGVAVISTYLGRGRCLFQFLPTIHGVAVSSTPEDHQLTPHVTYPPHWYQRLGFYG